jgi:hypothetical protein
MDPNTTVVPWHGHESNPELQHQSCIYPAFSHLAVLVVVKLLHDHLLQPDEELLEADAAAAVKVQLPKQLVAQRLGRPGSG